MDAIDFVERHCRFFAADEEEGNSGNDQSGNKDHKSNKS